MTTPCSVFSSFLGTNTHHTFFAVLRPMKHFKVILDVKGNILNACIWVYNIEQSRHSSTCIMTDAERLNALHRIFPLVFSFVIFLFCFVLFLQKKCYWSSLPTNIKSCQKTNKQTKIKINKKSLLRCLKQYSVIVWHTSPSLVL